MNISFDASGPQLLNLNLDFDGDGVDGDGDLAATGGNLYINVDGKEYGSLWFYQDHGRLVIELGQYDADSQGWETRNPLTEPVNVSD